MRHDVSRALAIAALLMCLPAVAAGQSLRWDALGSAGGFSSSPSASLGATTGQPVTGFSAGGSLLETVGFWHPPVPSLVGVDPSPILIPDLRLVSLAPNPATHAVHLRYAVPAAAGPITVDLIDLSGRVVRTLHAGPREPGLHTVTWDGRAGDGSLAASGIYFCRLQAAGHRSVRRLAVIR
jgi:hypothetical protein